MSFPSSRELLGRYQLRPKYSFGQNFLSDVSVAERIASAILGGPVPREKEEPPCEILEIGAGLGALTIQLLKRGHSVIAIERDRDLVPVLLAEFSKEVESGQLRVVEDDAKAVDWASLFSSEKPRILAGNLPYQITGPLIEKTCLFPGALQRAAYLVQKEVADRLAASPGTKDYGALSVFAQARFRVERAFIVGSGSFYPAPRVSSAVAVFHPHEVVWSEETPLFRQVVHAAFHARRKTLRNAWKGLAPAETLARCAEKTGIDLDQRGETLSVQQFAHWTQVLELEREPV